MEILIDVEKIVDKWIDGQKYQKDKQLDNLDKYVRERGSDERRFTNDYAQIY